MITHTRARTKARTDGDTNVHNRHTERNDLKINKESLLIEKENNSNEKESTRGRKTLPENEEQMVRKCRSGIPAWNEQG